jgi:Asp-tRNA(Asn)/Glu-tRNA(Gln) amidotransferase A subunit family amidase
MVMSRSTLSTTGHPDIEAAIDDALRTAGLDVIALDWDDFAAGTQAFTAIYFSEMWESDHALVASNPDAVGGDIAQTVAMADAFRPGENEARRALPAWRQSVLGLFDRVELLALPTLPMFPPRLDQLTADTMLPTVIEITKHVALFNAAGTPCTAQPVPVRGQALPASLQLVGPPDGEELLLATAELIEASSSAQRPV